MSAIAKWELLSEVIQTGVDPVSTLALPGTIPDCMQLKIYWGLANKPAHSTFVYLEVLMNGVSAENGAISRRFIGSPASAAPGDRCYLGVFSDTATDGWGFAAFGSRIGKTSSRKGFIAVGTNRDGTTPVGINHSGALPITAPIENLSFRSVDLNSVVTPMIGQGSWFRAYGLVQL